MASESRRQAASLRGKRRDASDRRVRRRDPAQAFASTTRALEALASAGAQVAVHVVDLDSGVVVLAGDDHVPMPIGGLGVVPLLVEAAARFEDGSLDPLEIADRSPEDAVVLSGLWRQLAAPALPLGDLAVLTAAVGDALAANLLLRRVGHESVTRRIVSLGMPRSALLDRFRDERGPDDAPYVAIGTAREYAELFSSIVNGRIVDQRVSAQVAEWLTLASDVGLVGATLGLDPYAHDDDKHGLLFLNKTGREDGVRADAGVIAGPRAGLAYSLIVGFDDLSALHRHRAHQVFHALGCDLMEFVH